MEQKDETLTVADSGSLELVENASVPMLPGKLQDDVLSDNDQEQVHQQTPVLALAPAPSILELDAEPRAQFRDNYRIAAAGDVSLSLKAGAAAGVFSIIHQFLAGPVDTSTLTPALVIVAFICLFRFLFVRKKAIALEKTKFVLTDTELTALGPDSTNDWSVPVTRIKKVAPITCKGKFQSLLFSAENKTFFIGGIASAEMLMERLPKEVKVGGSPLEEKLNTIATSSEFTESAETNKVSNYVNFQQSIIEEIRHLPNALLLNANTKNATEELYSCIIFTLVIIAGIALGWASYVVPCIPILAFISLSRLASIQKSIDCIYVVCPDAVFEIDRRGSKKRIPLNRISLGSEQLNNGSTSIIIDSWIRIPVNLDDAGFESLEMWLKNYPR